MADPDIGGPFDDELRSIARAALSEAERSVAVDGALADVRRRGLEPDEDEDLHHHRRGPSKWVLLGAAAAVLGMVGAGIVIGSREGADTTIRTNTVPPVTVAPSPTDVPASTVLSTLPPVTLPPATTEAPAVDPVVGEPQLIAVDAANPPPLIEPVPFAIVPIEPNPNGNAISVAIGAEYVVVQQPETSYVTLVGEGFDNVDVPIDETLYNIVAGPGNVVYGFGDPVFEDGSAVPTFRFVAVALAGERIGEAVAEAPLPAVRYVELPTGAFGHGPSGVIDRERVLNSEVIGYVDESGQPIAWAGENPPLLLPDIDVRGGVGSGVISVVDAEVSWAIDITRDPDSSDTFVGPSPPAPTSGGRVIYSETIGADTTPDADFGPNEMPVVAILEPDGSGSWVRLPDDWSVAASDVWGTVLMRTSNGEIELALLDDALAAAEPPQPDAPIEPEGDVLAIEQRCVGDFNFTRLANTLDGRMVAYDPPDNTLIVLDAAGAQVLGSVGVPVPSPQFLAMEIIGPDDVVYLSYTPSDAIDPIRQLIAVPLTGPSAGEIVASWSGLDGSGDTDLVPTESGLAVVNCCGGSLVRPAPDAELFGWVDRNGEPTTYDGPTFELRFGDGGDELTRIDGENRISFPLPTVAQSPRGMPWTVATSDGGAVMYVYDQFVSGRSYVVRFDPANAEPGGPGPQGSDVFLLEANLDIFDPSLVEPDGSVIRPIDGQLVRQQIEDIAAAGWDGRFVIELVDERAPVVAAFGLNDYIDAEQPRWAEDPLTLAVQLRPFVSGAAHLSATFEEATSTLTMTIEGEADDSVDATQYTIVLDVAADDLYRFVSGAVAWQCQPGRGQQDFGTDFCV